MGKGPDACFSIRHRYKKGPTPQPFYTLIRQTLTLREGEEEIAEKRA